MSAAPSGSSASFLAAAPVSAVPKAAAARSRRQPKWIAAGLLAICLGALGAVVLFTQAVGSTSVIQVTKNISRGEVIQASDLATITIGSAPGVSTVPADQLAGLVGMRAMVDLVRGALLPQDAIGEVSLPDGWVQMGLSLRPGKMPIEPLPPGTPIQLIAVPPSGGGADDGYTGKLVDGIVLTAPQESQDGQDTVLDIRVEAGSAALVARLAATDRLVLIRKPES
ncbi:MAG: SAF domain-containing protein [Propionibacteriaceae bacterium]